MGMAKQRMRRVREGWYWYLIGAVILGEAAVFLFFGENSYIAVHDNLDLFMGHFQAMKHAGAFFGKAKTVPILGGISRNSLSSEFSLYNILFFLLPPFAAYLCGYFLKILVALCSVWLLARDIYGENYKKYEPAAALCGLIYGLCPLFPAYGIAFSSIPLAVYLLRRIYRGESGRDYCFLFLYPLLSYFSYFGFFLLAYLALAVLILWIRDFGRAERAGGEETVSTNASPSKARMNFFGTSNKSDSRMNAPHTKAGRFFRALNVRLMAALFVLALGYMVFEYRLFYEMLFSDVVTIRSTMVEGSYDAPQILAAVWEVFFQGIFHAQPSHTRFVLPVCLAFFLYRIYCRVWKKEKGALTDAFCLVFYFILANCLIYGLYFWGGLRELFERLLPPLKGFQFNRTVFFNPFLWVAALFLAVKYLYDRNRKAIGNAVVLASLCVVVMTPAVYNDFYSTCYYNAYRLVKHTRVENLNFREFYSEELFDVIKREIGYGGEYAAAYGFHPAVLSYNGIATLDGYLGLYPQEYKERFGAMIEPATRKVEEWDSYFWDWGARAYLFSGSGENTWNPVRTMEVADDRLYIDGGVFRELGGKYLFSRIQIGNAQELGFVLLGGFGYGDSPYTIYVYEMR